MIPWDELADLFEELAGVPVIWDGAPVPFVPPKNRKPGSLVTLNVSSSRARGIDETVREWDASAEALAVVQRGLRSFVISARAESFSSDLEAVDVLERIRTRIRRDTSRAALRAAGCSLIETLPTVDLSGRADTRATSRASMDLRFALAVNDTVEDAGDVIETVDVRPSNTFR